MKDKQQMIKKLDYLNSNFENLNKHTEDEFFFEKDIFDLKGIMKKNYNKTLTLTSNDDYISTYGAIQLILTEDVYNKQNLTKTKQKSLDVL